MHSKFYCITINFDRTYHSIYRQSPIFSIVTKKHTLMCRYKHNRCHCLSQYEIVILCTLLIFPNSPLISLSLFSAWGTLCLPEKSPPVTHILHSFAESKMMSRRWYFDWVTIAKTPLNNFHLKIVPSEQ